MRTADAIEQLATAGIQPSSQRVAVAKYVLSTDDHPSADQVFAKVKGDLPVLSRATVYNTLNLVVEKGLLRQHVLAEGRVVFDPNVEPHHHFVDDKSGAIVDIPWDAIDVRRVEDLHGFDVREFQVVLRGRKKR